MKKPQSLEDSDLSRLYTATSLMQIDDNVMRCVHARGWGPGRGVGGQEATVQRESFRLPTLVLRALFFPLDKMSSV